MSEQIDTEMIRRAAEASRSIQKQEYGSRDWFIWVPRYLDGLAGRIDAEQAGIGNDLLVYARVLRDHVPASDVSWTLRCQACDGEPPWPCEPWTRASEALDE